MLLLSSPAALADPGIMASLNGIAGDTAIGRSIVVNRHIGMCLLCHSGPFPEERFQGNLAPSLAGVGSRLTSDQLRLRIVDSQRINPESIMPSYLRTSDLWRVSPAYRGQTLLTPSQIEDVVAFLTTLK